jgi:predicted amino acid racemase
MQYVMAAYQAMGPVKGANIQGILTNMGCTNINEVKPEQYGQLYSAVEQLKAS